MLHFIFKAHTMYKYRRSFAVLQFRFPVIFSLSALGMVIYWVSRLLFVFIVIDRYIQFYGITLIFVFCFFFILVAILRKTDTLLHTQHMRKHTKQK